MLRVLAKRFFVRGQSGDLLQQTYFVRLYGGGREAEEETRGAIYGCI